MPAFVLMFHVVAHAGARLLARNVLLVHGTSTDAAWADQRLTNGVFAVCFPAAQRSQRACVCVFTVRKASPVSIAPALAFGWAAAPQPARTTTTSDVASSPCRVTRRCVAAHVLTEYVVRWRRDVAPSQQHVAVVRVADVHVGL